jgi:hypothetical protein
LPRIDQVIDYTAGCDLLCFLDCYSGYHQIAIKEEDQEKTTFITPFGAYCYTTMSFGLVGMVRRCWKDLAPSAVQTQEPKTKVSPRLKAIVGLMKMEVVEFAI